jgi:hypothetical protein
VGELNLVPHTALPSSPAIAIAAFYRTSLNLFACRVRSRSFIAMSTTIHGVLNLAGRPAGIAFRDLLGIKMRRPAERRYRSAIGRAPSNPHRPFGLMTEGPKPLEVTETADPIEAWKPIRGTGVRRARVPRMGISKTTMRDVLVIVHKALPPEQRDQTKPRP